MRVIDTPISESAIVGVSIGAALRGYRPSPRCSSPTSSPAASIRSSTRPRRCATATAAARRCRSSSGRRAAATSAAGCITHRIPRRGSSIGPGLKVVAPSTAYDAKGLLKAAIRDDNPVVYFEHKYLYRRAKGPVPEGDEIVPIGVAATRREGSDITLLTYGAMVTPSLEAADRLSKEGVEVEVIDLRTLLPLDKAAIFRIAREDEPRAHRPRRREDARHRRRALGGDHGRAVRPPRCAGPARHLSRHASAVLARARGRRTCPTRTRSPRRSDDSLLTSRTNRSTAVPACKETAAGPATRRPPDSPRSVPRGASARFAGPRQSRTARARRTTR